MCDILSVIEWKIEMRSLKMRSYKKQIAVLLAGIFALSQPFAGMAADSYGFSARVYGPGVENLSAGDPYARYQWGCLLYTSRCV